MKPSFLATSSNNEFPEQIAGIDLAVGLELLSGKKPLYLQMLRKFLAGHKHASREIRRALAVNDWETAELIAHNTKGVSSYIGATLLQRCAAYLEEAFRMKNPDFAPLLLHFETALQEVMSDLASKLPPEHNSAPATQVLPPVASPP